MENKEIKAKFEKGKFIPLERVNLREGDIINIEITIEKDEEFSWKGALKNIKSSSVELQHRIKDEW